MMVPLLLSIKEELTYHGVPMKPFLTYVGISRQGFNKAIIRYEQENSMVNQIKVLVADYRRYVDRRAGSRSLFYNLGIKERFHIGVTKFEQLLADNKLSLNPLRVRVVTTKSCLQSWNYNNLINGLSVDNINQVVVGDLTYINFRGKRYFLFCLTDIYSARIVGYHIDENMKAEKAYMALIMWIRLRGVKSLKLCIHHTDGGSQYFSALYLNKVKDLNIQVSCAENCLRNGYAEQRNGFIKHHLLPLIDADSLEQLQTELKRVIKNYNFVRKQEKLSWLSPVEYERKISVMDKKPVLKLYKFKTQ